MCPQCVPFEDRKSKLASTVDSYLPRSAWDPSPTPLSKERMVDRGGVRVWLQLGLDCERLCSCPQVGGAVASPSPPPPPPPLERTWVVVASEVSGTEAHIRAALQSERFKLFSNQTLLRDRGPQRLILN